ncbi:SPT10-like protein [Elsinoe fawcettii]|nr:SPT10-like protein [Elsinoe fawcettii]
MPAMLDDPTAPAIYRTSGSAPFPVPGAPLPPNIKPLHIALRDKTIGTLIPFASSSNVPKGLLARLNTMLNAEIEGGDTYPMTSTMDLQKFSTYWFANFAAVLVSGELDLTAGLEGVYGQLAAMERLNEDWTARCLGTYYIKPNYPGRSSHVCNAGFLVSDVARGKGVGTKMGGSYIAWGARLGYKYSIFNLVYETNTASLKIWDGLNFSRVGRVKGAGSLRSYPDRLVDAIVYGRDLVDHPDPVAAGDTEQEKGNKWFGRLAFLLQSEAYPVDADEAEIRVLRRHRGEYKWVSAREGQGEQGRYMVFGTKRKGRNVELKVLANAKEQWEVTRRCHEERHEGVNAVCASLTDRYYWKSVRETVEAVIGSCRFRANKTVRNCRTKEELRVMREESGHCSRPGVAGTGNGLAATEGQVSGFFPPYSFPTYTDYQLENEIREIEDEDDAMEIWGKVEEEFGPIDLDVDEGVLPVGGFHFDADDLAADTDEVDLAVNGDADGIDLAVNDDADGIDLAVNDDADGIDLAVNRDADGVDLAVKGDAVDLAADVDGLDLAVNGDADGIDLAVNCGADGVDLAVKGDAVDLRMLNREDEEEIWARLNSQDGGVEDMMIGGLEGGFTFEVTGDDTWEE